MLRRRASVAGSIQSSHLTRPVRNSYTAPTTFSSPFLTNSDRMGSRPLSLSTPIWTLALMALSSLSPGFPLTEAAAGLITSTRSRIEPGRVSLASMWATAALTAPHGLVAQHDDEPGAQLRDRELDAPFHEGARATDDVPRHADDEQVADSLVEDQFGRHSRVGAPDDDGKRSLPFGQRCEVLRLPSRVGELTLDETLVALDELGEHSVGVAGGGQCASGGFILGLGADCCGEGEAGRADRQSGEPHELATRRLVDDRVFIEDLAALVCCGW